MGPLLIVIDDITHLKWDFQKGNGNFVKSKIANHKTNNFVFPTKILIGYREGRKGSLYK